MMPRWAGVVATALKYCSSGAEELSPDLSQGVSLRSCFAGKSDPGQLQC